MENDRALARPRDRMVAGVISGIAHYFHWPVDRTRVAFVVLSVLSAGFPGILVYLLLWLVMPEADRPTRRFQLDHPAPRDRIPPE